MKRYRKLLHLSLAAGLLLAAAAVRADTLTLTLDAPFQSQPGPGNVFTFSGTIDYTSTDAANDGNATELLNGATVIFTGPNTGLSDVTPFFDNAPLTMDATDNTSGDIDLFTVTVPGYTAGSSNFYTGSFEILGGPNPDGSDLQVLATGDFDIQVTPEPASLLLLASGLAGMMTARKLRKA